MKKSDRYTYIKYYFEDRFNDINEKYYKVINDFLSKHNTELASVLNNLYGDNEEKFNLIHDYILKYNFEIEYLYELIKKYDYNFFHTLLWGIYSICNTNYPKAEEYIINMLLKSPYIYKINRFDDYYVIDCILGKIPFKKASTYFGELNKLELKNYVDGNNLTNLCRNNSVKVVSSIKGSTAYTGLCNQTFIGTFYHSIAVHNKNCIDLNYKTVIPFDIYKNITNFKPIIKIEHEKINYIEDEELLLYLALYCQAEDKEIQKKLKLTFQ